MSSGGKKSALPYKAFDHYSNILLLAPDGQALATIPAKRARWYKKRELVEVLENREGYTEVLRLKIEPAGRPSKAPEPLSNRCVVCGSTEELSSHHVVPKAIRSHFEDEEKNHSSNWCVLVCEKHHLAAEKLARQVYERTLQEATGAAHQSYTVLCSSLVKQAVERGEDPKLLDFSVYHGERKQAIKAAQKACVEQMIQDFGGVEEMKRLFRDLFLLLIPRYLPKGFLSNDWQK